MIADSASLARSMVSTRRSRSSNPSPVPDQNMSSIAENIGCIVEESILAPSSCLSYRSAFGGLMSCTMLDMFDLYCGPVKSLAGCYTIFLNGN